MINYPMIVYTTCLIKYEKLKETKTLKNNFYKKLVKNNFYKKAC